MPVWRCPHCATPQAEASRCWVCRRVHHLLRDLPPLPAGDRRRARAVRPRSAAPGGRPRPRSEPCWVAAPPPADPGAAAARVDADGARRTARRGALGRRSPRTFVPVEALVGPAEVVAVAVLDGRRRSPTPAARGPGAAVDDEAARSPVAAAPAPEPDAPGPRALVAVGRPGALAGALAAAVGPTPRGRCSSRRRRVAAVSVIVAADRGLLPGRRLLLGHDPGRRHRVGARRDPSTTAERELVRVDQGRRLLDRHARVVADVLRPRRRRRASGGRSGCGGRRRGGRRRRRRRSASGWARGRRR